MNDIIEFKKPSGEVIKAELISYFYVASMNKKFVFFTNNEVVENDLIKMYVASVLDDNMSINQNITDDEWNSLKMIMKQILTGNVTDDVRYLKIEGEK